MKKLQVLILCLLSLFVFTAFSVSLDAVSAYKTYTTDRNNRLQETNEAYEAIQMIRILSDGSTLNAAKDMAIDVDDYLYIADTGNKRIVILSPTYQVLHTFGSDVFDRPMGIHVLGDKIYVADYGKGQLATDLGSIFIYQFDKSKIETSEAITLLHQFSTPSSPILAADSFRFRPMKITVDQNQTMFIVNEGTTSGVLMVNQNNRFINYFASNKVDLTLMERINRILYQFNEDVYFKKNIPAPVLNVALDPVGYFYTISQKQTTQSMGDNLKKVNIGGINFFQEQMFVYSDIVDIYPGKVGNVYAVTSAGFILEYDSLGNLLFLFGGRGTGRDKLGLFLSASSLVVDSKNQILVLDDHASRNSIQIFRQTPFAYQVHQALDLYNQAKYVESIEVWNEVLRYNSMLDMAYRGKGLGHLMNEEYEAALEHFFIAHDKVNYSEAFWELRNVWMMEHASFLFWVVFGLLLLVFIYPLLNKKYHLNQKISKGIFVIRRVSFIDQLCYFMRFLTHPSDACFEVKSKQRIKPLAAWVMMLLFFLLYIIGLSFTGFIFNTIIIEETILFKEALVLLIPLLLFIVSNYLMSSLMEGEGTLKATFTTTIGALVPILVLYPIAILLSNVLSLNEGFLYTMILFVMTAWVAILLFFIIKETQNYTVGQTIVNILLSILTMIVLLVVLLLVLLMISQVFGFGSDILKELILRE